MDIRFNPLKNIQFASRRDLIQALAWMWGTIISLSLVLIYAGSVWLSQLLVIAGALITFSVPRRAQSGRVQRAPAPYLSGASKCVWQMDREG